MVGKRIGVAISAPDSTAALANIQGLERGGIASAWMTSGGAGGGGALDGFLVKGEVADTSFQVAALKERTSHLDGKQLIHLQQEFPFQPWNTLEKFAMPDYARPTLTPGVITSGAIPIRFLSHELPDLRLP